jgi:hypothetical protein
VVGGLAFSQFVTLFVTPVFYSYLDELQTWFANRKATTAVPLPHEELGGGGLAPAGD